MYLIFFIIWPFCCWLVRQTFSVIASQPLQWTASSLQQIMTSMPSLNCATDVQAAGITLNGLTKTVCFTFTPYFGMNTFVYILSFSSATSPRVLLTTQTASVQVLHAVHCSCLTSSLRTLHLIITVNNWSRTAFSSKQFISPTCHCSWTSCLLQVCQVDGCGSSPQIGGCKDKHFISIFNKISTTHRFKSMQFLHKKK